MVGKQNKYEDENVINIIHTILLKSTIKSLFFLSHSKRPNANGYEK